MGKDMDCCVYSVSKQGKDSEEQIEGEILGDSILGNGRMDMPIKIYITVMISF